MIKEIREITEQMASCDECQLNDHHMEHIRAIEHQCHTHRIELAIEDIDNNKGGAGLEIRVPGFKGSPESPDDGQIFIEYYEGKVRVHVWNGDQDPITTEIEKE